ncbi:hypothetical protein Tco_1181736 [Tanacetum coccineum]
MVIPMSSLIPPIGVDTQILESSKDLEMKSDTTLKYFEFECEGYRSETSLLVVRAISSKDNITRSAGRNGFGLYGLSSVIGSSLGVTSGDDGI